ncbi:MAG: hypothetical protein JNL87_22565 [Burkholderiaceae bacterium]|nr:hypothetical protein [Burkholderiaceae bacterium]
MRDGRVLAVGDLDRMRGFAAIACAQGATTATDLVNRLGADDIAVLERATADDGYGLRILPAFQAFQAFHGGHGAREGAEDMRAPIVRNTDRLRYGRVEMMLDGSIQSAGRHGSLRTTLVPPAGEAAVVVAIGLAGRLPRPALDAPFAGA